VCVQRQHQGRTRLHQADSRVSPTVDPTFMALGHGQRISNML
jgi:hypothetical protein